MAGTYTVKSGDTLSGIASNLGLSHYNQLTGYRSGNPNLIYPGEVLRYGTTSAPKTSTAKPKASPASTASSQASTYQKQADKLYGELGALDKAAQNPLDIYNAALESLGISDARTRVTSLREQMMNTENLLRNVEGNVTARTSGSLVTEAQRQRLANREREPIAEELRTAGQNFELAQGDYGMIMTEGTKKAELQYQGQRDKRQNVIDRMEIARDNAKTAEDKRRWEVKIALEKQKMAEDKRQFEKSLAAKKASASSSRGGSRRSSGRSSGGGSSSMSGIDAHFDAMWKKKPYASRQEQDSWINSWFAKNGIKDPEDRQDYWNFINSTRKRPENPHDDWLYKR